MESVCICCQFFFNPLTVFCSNEIYSGGMGLQEEDHLNVDLYE